MIERVLAAPLPEHDRDAVLGDLYEEIHPGDARITVRRLFAILGVGLRYEIEPYVRGTDVREAGGLLAAGVGSAWRAPGSVPRQGAKPSRTRSAGLARLAGPLRRKPRATRAIPPTG